MRKIGIGMLIVVMLTAFWTMPSYARSFLDISKDHWAYSYIDTLSDKGVINGYEDGQYKPEKNVTRGEFLKLVMTSVYGKRPFSKPVSEGQHWATNYAVSASRKGFLMSGTSVDGLDQAISRMEMIHILAKVCADQDLENTTLKEAIDFQDIKDVDETSRIYIDFVVTNGLINGYTDGTIKLNKNMTRAEVATVISRLFELIEAK